MTRPHRRAHLVLWLIVAPLSLGALVLGVIARTGPINEMSASEVGE